MSKSSNTPWTLFGDVRRLSELGFSEVRKSPVLRRSLVLRCLSFACFHLPRMCCNARPSGSRHVFQCLCRSGTSQLRVGLARGCRQQCRSGFVASAQLPIFFWCFALLYDCSARVFTSPFHIILFYGSRSAWPDMDATSLPGCCGDY